MTQKQWQAPMVGGCRCGGVRFQLTAPPIFTSACHCRGCQRMSASAFSLSAAFPAEHFTLTKGEPVIGGLHGEHRHYHCPHCKSWMFTRPHGFDNFVNVRATMLDCCEDFAPFIETGTSEKFRWASTPAKFSFEQFPPMEEFDQILAEFAALELS